MIHASLQISQSYHTAQVIERQLRRDNEEADDDNDADADADDVNNVDSSVSFNVM